MGLADDWLFRLRIVPDATEAKAAIDSINKLLERMQRHGVKPLLALFRGIARVGPTGLFGGILQKMGAGSKATNTATIVSQIMRGFGGTAAKWAGPVGLMIQAIPVVVKGLGLVTNALLAVGSAAWKVSQIPLKLLIKAIQGTATVAVLVSKGMAIAATAAGKVGLAPFTLLANGLYALQSPLGIIGGAIRGTQQTVYAITNLVKHIPLIGRVLEPLGNSLGNLLGIFHNVTLTLLSMSRMAHPGAYRLYQMAHEDNQSAIGNSFTPIVQLMTLVTRDFGSILLTIIPTMQDVIKIIAIMRPEFESLRNEILQVVKEVGPMIKFYLVGALKAAAFGVGLLTMQLRLFFRLITNSPLYQLYRHMTRNQHLNELPSTVGMTARGASIQNVREYHRNMITNALSMPGGSAPERTATATEAIRNILTQMWNRGSGLFNQPGDVNDQFSAIRGQLRQNVANVGGDGAANIFDGIAAIPGIQARPLRDAGNAVMDGIEAGANWLADPIGRLRQLRGW